MPDQPFPIYLSTHAASVAHFDPACTLLRKRPEFYGESVERRAQTASRPDEVVLLALVGHARIRLLRRCPGCGTGVTPAEVESIRAGLLAMAPGIEGEPDA